MNMNDLSHSWNVTPAEAIAIQKTLRDKILLQPLEKPVRIVGGADVSMNMFSTDGYAGFVVLEYPGLQMIDHAVVQSGLRFPYIPGLLSFREIPLLMQAWEKLKTKPDVIVVDGVGIAHPRRLGIATHLGLILDVPTIGCAKSVLTGVYDEPGNEPGDFSFMRDKKGTDGAEGEIIGAALRTKRNVKPVYVSPGHLITLEESIDIVRHSIVKHRLPEETRFAHNTVNEYRRGGAVL